MFKDEKYSCYTVWRKKNACFSNNCNFVYFQYKKNYIITKTTCNKSSFDYLHWLLIYGKLYRKDGVLLAVHASGAFPQCSASHLLTFLVAHLQFLREWKLSNRRLYEVFERRLLIWGNPKERNRRQIILVSVGAKGHRRNARLRVTETFVEQLSWKPLQCGLWLHLVGTTFLPC